MFIKNREQSTPWLIGAPQDPTSQKCLTLENQTWIPVIFILSADLIWKETDGSTLLPTVKLRHLDSYNMTRLTSAVTDEK